MTKPSVRLIVLIGLILLLAATAVISRRHDPMFGVDGETYYIAARTLMAGANPYSNADMVRVGLIVDPADVISKGGVQQMTNLPASILPFLPLSLLPAHAFDWTLIVLSAFCIPLVIVLSGRLLRVEPSNFDVAVMSILAALFPPVWRSLIVGQPLAPILACLLAICCLAAAPSSDQNPRRAAGLTLLSLVKATCSLPLAAWILITGSNPFRAAVVAALGLFALLNVVLIAHIGLHTFLHSYQTSSALFTSGGANDPYSGGHDIRIDLQPLATLLTSPAHLGAVSAALDLLAAAPLLALLILRPSARVGDALIAVLLLTLLVTYHRPYDAVLAIPVLPLIFRDWRAGDHPTAALRAAAFLAAAAVLGDHNIQAILLRHSPNIATAWIRPTSIIALYLSVTLPTLQSSAHISASHTALASESQAALTPNLG